MTPYYYRYLRDCVARIRSQLLYAACHFMPQMPYGKRVMIVAPHPDDETFGAGAYICSLLANGSKVRVVVLSSGGRSLGDSDDSTEVERQRELLCLRATSILGLGEDDVVFLRQPDGSVLTDSDMVGQLRYEVESWKPDMLLSPGFGEVWSDHINTAKVVLHIANNNCMVYHYWVWSWYYNTLSWYGRMYCNIGSRSCCSVKQKAVDVYIKSKRSDGNVWSGNLPMLLIKCIRQDNEIFCKMTVCNDNK
ncbi:MAG: PIG-L family deacetylase [Bacteroides sp.]|nr:PIG-L family deacetylase [Bacteroides sp.]